MNNRLSFPGPEDLPSMIYPLPELCYPHQMNAIRVLMEQARIAGWGERPAFYYKDEVVRYRDVWENVNNFSYALTKMGVAPSDRVVIRIKDSPELIYSIMAVQKIGAIAIPTYSQFRAEDLIYRVNDSGSSLAMIGSDLLDEFIPVADACPILKDIIVLYDDPTGRFTSMNEMLAGEILPVDYADTHRDDPALILYTSGSTGDPKGAAHTHADLLSVCDSYCRYCVKPGADDVFAGPPSIPFAMGFGFFFLFPLRFGAAAVIEPQKTPNAYISAINKHKVTIFVGIPTFYNMMLQFILKESIELPHIKLALCGGEPLKEELARKWREATGIPITQFLGCTELLHIFLSYRKGEDELRPGSVGCAVPGYQVAVRDPDTFEPLPAGRHGILTVIGPTGTKYINKPEQQRKAVTNGWNVIQDIVWSDEEGFIHYVSRRDDMIMSGGYTISPTDVENVLMKHGSILESACVSAPDPAGVRANIVKAYIVLKPDADRSDGLKKQIQDFFKSEAPPYMYPREIEFVESLPKTLSGKIRYFELRQQAWAVKQV